MVLAATLGALTTAGIGAQQVPGSHGAPPDAPGAAAVARRALVLDAVHTLRFEPLGEKKILPALNEPLNLQHLRIKFWLEQQRLWERTSAWERRVIDTDAGRLSPTDSRAVHAMRESRNILLYALGVYEGLPFPDRVYIVNPLWRLFPGSGQPVQEFVRDARLRPRDQLWRTREETELWYLRGVLRLRAAARDYPEGEEFHALERDLTAKAKELGLELRPVLDGPGLFRELVRYSAHWAHGHDMAGRPIDGDFPVLATIFDHLSDAPPGRAEMKPYWRLDETEFRHIHTLCEERLRALVWLTEGDNELWERAGPLLTDDGSGGLLRDGGVGRGK